MTPKPTQAKRDGNMTVPLREALERLAESWEEYAAGEAGEHMPDSTTATRSCAEELRAALASASPTEPSDAAIDGALWAHENRGDNAPHTSREFMRAALRVAYHVDGVRAASPAPLSAAELDDLEHRYHGARDASETNALCGVLLDALKQLRPGSTTPKEGL